MRPASIESNLARLVALLVLFLPAQAAWAQNSDDPPPPGTSPEELDPDQLIAIAVREDGIPLEEFLKYASQQTGKIFAISPKAAVAIGQGQRRGVQLTNTVAVKRKDYFETFKAILKANDLHVFPIGDPEIGLYLVEDLANNASKGEAKTKASFVEYAELLADPSWRWRTEIISTVISFKHMDASRAKSDLQQIVNTREAGAITTIPAVNSIIVTEFASVVYHVARMLSLMDQQEERFILKFEKIRLEYADPEELQPILADLLETDDGGLFGSSGGGGQQRNRAQASTGAVRKAPSPKIIPDARTNSLILYAVEEDITEIKDLVQKLDEKVDSVVPDIWRYQLKHAVADEVAETLNEIVDASSGGRLSRSRTAGNRSQQSGGTGFVEQEIVIVPEQHTNSLLIRASSTQYQWIKDLLADIDRRLPQVLIEAAIVELTENFTDAFGVELGYLDLADDPNANITRGFGFTGFGLTEFQDTNGDGIPDLRLPSLEGLATGGFTGGIFNFPGFQTPFILNMIGTDNQSNLLSIPSVLTNDNASATITVAESQTTTTSSLSGGGVAQGGFGGFEEAPLTLSISPHISADDYLRLDIELLVENFVGSERTIGDQVIPAPKLTRELVAQVTVPNNATVVIGGLTQKQLTEDRTKTPFLGDLPLLGWLFRSETTTERKSTLYLFVTPHILKDEDFEDLYDLTYLRELEVQALVGDNVTLFDPKFEENHRRRQAAAKEGIVIPEEDDLLDIPRYRSPSELPSEAPEPVEDEEAEAADPESTEADPESTETDSAESTEPPTEEG